MIRTWRIVNLFAPDWQLVRGRVIGVSGDPSGMMDVDISQYDRDEKYAVIELTNCDAGKH
jgi:hypothetical protein